MATVQLKGQTIAPTGTRAGITNPPLGQLPIVQTPTSPTANNPAIAPTGSGVGTVQNNLSVNQSTTPNGGFVPMVNTPFTANQNEAMTSLANTPVTNPSMDYAANLMRDLGTKSSAMFDEYIPKANQAFDPSTMVSQYMNPYLEQVLTPTLERLRRERNITQSGIGEQASKVGAFGGTREGVQRSLNDEAFDRNTAETTGNLYYGGYNDAITRAMGQFENERNRNFSTATLGSTNAANAANNLFNFGQQQIGNYRQSAQDKLGVGGLQQDLQQKDLNAVNAELEKQQGFDMNRIKDLLSVLSGLPTGGGTSTTKPGLQNSDVAGQLLGGAAQYDWTKLFNNSAGGVYGNSGGTGIGVPTPRY